MNKALPPDCAQAGARLPARVTQPLKLYMA